MQVPDYLPYYVLVGTAGIIAAVLFGLNRSLQRAHWPTERRLRTLAVAATVLGAWLAGAMTLSLLGTFHAGADTLPSIQYAIGIPILVGALLIWRSPVVGEVIDAVPQSWLIGVQVYRALGVIFLILYATDRLPGLFAWPAGLGDILVGVLAPVVAIAYARAPQQNGDLASAWNWFGIGDLVIAVGTGFVTAPSLLQPFTVEPPNQLIASFPLALIPTFLVPLSILLHAASLTKLHRATVRAKTPGPVLA